MDMFMTLFYKMLRNRLPNTDDDSPSGGEDSPPSQTVIKDSIVSGDIQYDKNTGIVSGKTKTEDGILIL